MGSRDFVKGFRGSDLRVFKVWGSGLDLRV